MNSCQDTVVYWTFSFKKKKLWTFVFQPVYIFIGLVLQLLYPKIQSLLDIPRESMEAILSNLDQIQSLWNHEVWITDLLEQSVSKRCLDRQLDNQYGNLNCSVIILPIPVLLLVDDRVVASCHNHATVFRGVFRIYLYKHFFKIKIITARASSCSFLVVQKPTVRLVLSWVESKPRSGGTLVYRTVDCTQRIDIDS